MVKNSPKINKKILQQDNRITRLPLDIWSKDITIKLSRISSPQLLLEKLEEFATSLNQAALILSYGGHINAAREGCARYITFYYPMLKKYQTADIYHYLIQAWINMGRLDRLCKCHDQALDKFLLILGFASTDNLNTTYKDTENLVKLSLEIFKNNEQAHNFVRDIAILEVVKTCLESSNYELLLQMFPIAQRKAINPVFSMVTEAQVIALCHLEQYEQALDLSKNIALETNPLAKYAFHFRQIELLNILEDKIKLQKHNNLLLNLVQKEEFNDDTQQIRLELIYQYAVLLLSISQPNLAFELLESCYKGYSQLQDELGMYFSLRQLMRLFGKKNNSYEIGLNSLINNSSYYLINNELSHKSILLSMDLLRLITDKLETLKIN